MDETKTPLQFMGGEHKRLIAECHDKGHRWGGWENMKYVSGSSRCCSRCKLHVSMYPDKKVQSYAIGSTWESYEAAIPFINNLAYRSSVEIKQGVVR